MMTTNGAHDWRSAQRRCCWPPRWPRRGTAWAAGGEHVHIDRQKWSFGGFLGKFDEAQLQRGFKVYMEVCARCHGLKRLAFRNLAEPGGRASPKAPSSRWRQHLSGR